MTLAGQPPRTLAELVSRCRKDRGLTQAAFGVACGVGQTQVGHWELGRARQPRPENLAKLAEVCGVSAGQVMALTGYFDLPPERVKTLTPEAGKARLLRDLERTGRRLSPAQLRALLAVARAMSRE